MKSNIYELNFDEDDEWDCEDDDNDFDDDDNW